jgi:hypothetical protein
MCLKFSKIFLKSGVPNQTDLQMIEVDLNTTPDYCKIRSTFRKTARAGVRLKWQSVSLASTKT